jgi:hypothetical protein
MSKGLRLSEKWFQRGLWLIAVIFAGFLIGLGRLVVDDLPKVEKPLSPELFMDTAQLNQVRSRMQADSDMLKQNEDATSVAALNEQHASEEAQAEQSSFNNWVATRSATEQSSQNAELVQRTHRLDAVKAAAREAQKKQDALESARLQMRQASDADHATKERIEAAGQAGYDRAVRKDELQVFLMRLALTLPLLLIAGLLFAKARKSSQWPFVWGFIFFALFTFFVELVPYLPSYGGYVRYIVGIVLTILAGNYSIRALQRSVSVQDANGLSISPTRSAMSVFTAAFWSSKPVRNAEPGRRFLPISAGCAASQKSNEPDSVPTSPAPLSPSHSPACHRRAHRLRGFAAGRPSSPRPCPSVPAWPHRWLRRRGPRRPR